MKNQIKIGNQTACSTKNILDPFDTAVELSFMAFEWFPDKKQDYGWDEFDLDDTTIEKAKTISKKNVIEFSIHMNNKTNVFKKDFVHYIETDIRLAQKLGSNKLITHFQVENGIEKYFKHLIPLLEKTYELNIQLLIENTIKTGFDDFNRLFDHLSNVSHNIPITHIGMCFDVGHANIWHQTRNNYNKYLDSLDSHIPIKHIHMHKNDGLTDSHDLIFKDSGNFENNLDGFFQKLQRKGFLGNIILEHWPNDSLDLKNEYQVLMEYFK